MAVTLKDIARHCGVSFSTVSGILGKRSHLFREDTCKKVIRAAKELGYRPHAVARAMRQGTFGAIALIMGTRGTVSATPPYLLTGIQEVMAKAGMHLSIAWASDEQLTNNQYLPDIFQMSFADGLMINYTHEVPDTMIDIVDEMSVPAIWINIKKANDTVRPDDMLAAQNGTEILISHGHKRIVYITRQGATHYHAADRRSGYETAMDNASLPSRVIGLEQDCSMEKEMELYHDILSETNRPTALFTAYGKMALRIFFCATQRLGLKVPQDISILTFSEPQPFGQDPEFDAMVLQNAELGRAAAEIILQRVKQPDKPLPERLIPMEYVSGLTVGAPPR